MFIHYYNLILFFMKIKKIKSNNTVYNATYLAEFLQKEIKNLNKKSFDQILEYEAKNYINSLLILKRLNRKERRAYFKFKEMKKIFDIKKEYKYYKSLYDFIFYIYPFNENPYLEDFFYHHTLIQISYIDTINFINEEMIVDNKYLIKLINDLFERFKVYLKKFQILKSTYFNIKSFKQFHTLRRESCSEIILKSKIENLHKISNFFCVKENKEIIVYFIAANNMQRNSKIESFLCDLMSVEIEYWCLFDKIRTQINSDDKKLVVSRLENCIKRYSDVRKIFSAIKSIYLKRSPKLYEDRRLIRSETFIFISQYLNLKILFQEIENLFVALNIILKINILIY